MNEIETNTLKKKENKFKYLMKKIFVKNWDLKLGAIALGFFCWLLVMIAI